MSSASDNCALDPFGQTQFEKIRLAALFSLLHDRFVAPVGIAAEHRWLLIGRAQQVQETRARTDPFSRAQNRGAACR